MFPHKHIIWLKRIQPIEMLINCAIHDSTEISSITLEKRILPEDCIAKVIKFSHEIKELVNL